MSAYAPCDLCGARAATLVLESPRLDGPLVRCTSCGLHYVGARTSDFTFSGEDRDRSTELAGRVAALELVRHDVEDAEIPLRLQADRERLARLLRHKRSGRLLDVGSALGTFLSAARGSFDAAGVEPDPGTSELARAGGLNVTTGTLNDVARAGTEPYDAITMFHVIEHLDSPRKTLATVSELLAPGGVVIVETPTIANLPYRLAPKRWRQLIPDHYFFFDRGTLERLLIQTGLVPLDYETVGREVSLRFLADRVRRANLPGAGATAGAVGRLGLGDRTVRINPGDIMSITARRPG